LTPQKPPPDINPHINSLKLLQFLASDYDPFEELDRIIHEIRELKEDFQKDVQKSIVKSEISNSQ
jgi:hypothetical protein